MKPAIVVDTNVPIAANGQTPQAGRACVQACVEALVLVRKEHRVLLDQGGLILREYRKNLSPAGQPGVGDMFFKWLWDNQANDLVCRRVLITLVANETIVGGENFAEFPTDPDLADFDPADRKFVAAALASGEATSILNASDTDWWTSRQALARNNVRVIYLCPDLMTSTNRPRPATRRTN